MVHRIVPPLSQKIAMKAVPAVAYVYKRGERFVAVGYFGKAEKPTFHYSFKTAQKREEHVRQFFMNCLANVTRKAVAKREKQEALDKPHGLKVGDALVSSWGYDQTNIDYYQVVELVGKRSVKIRKIAAEQQGTEYMQGKSVPLIDSFVGEPMLKKVDLYDSVKIASYASARKVEQIIVAGKPVAYKPSHWTAYA